MSFADIVNSQEAVITRKEAAAALHCDPRLISEGIKSGKIPHVMLGRRAYILREPFIAMLKGF